VCCELVALFLCALFLTCVRDFAMTLAFMCVSLSLILVVFIGINLVRVRDSNLWRLLTKGVLEKRKKIVVLKSDLWITWEKLSAILDRRRSPQRGVGIGRTMIKMVVSCPFYLLQLLSSWVLIFSCNIAPKFNTHLKGAIKWRVFPSSLFSS